jgi:hypothetical protein
MKSFLFGLTFSIAFGLIYFLVFHEAGSLFYPFAAIAFVGGPCLAGLRSVANKPTQKIRRFLVAGLTVYGAVLVLFFIMYAVVPAAERTSIQLPATCDGSYSKTPSALAYTLPDNKGVGILVTGDEHTAVVATITQNQPPYPSNVYLVDKSSNRILWATQFPNDEVMAVVSDGIAYIYNDKLGYFLDARTGEFKKRIFTIDNYGGLSQSDRPILPDTSGSNWYVETSAVISSWNMDGSVHSRPYLILNAIARGCFVNGKTGEITKL